MQRLLFIPCFALALLLGGCGPSADTGVAQHYRGRGIAFDYPAPWKVTTDVPLSSGYVISLEEPGAASATFAIFPAELNNTLEDYVEVYVKQLKAGLPPNAFQPKGTDVRPGGTDVRFAFKSGSIELPCTVNLTRHELGKLTVFCITQVADEDRAHVQAAFDRIRQSLASDPGE